MKLKEDKPNPNVIMLPAVIDNNILKSIADGMESSFITDYDQLMAVLSIFGIKDIEQALTLVTDFFLRNVKIKKITIDSVQNINLTNLTYEFIKETGFTKTVFSTKKEKKMVLSIFYKLGRLYLHDVLFHELILVNPNLAYSMLNMLKRTINSVCLAQGFDKKEAFKELMLDQIEIPFQKALPEKSVSKNKIDYHITKVQYIQLGKSELRDVEQIAETLYSDHDAIAKKSAFVALVNSQGETIELMEVNAVKIKLIAHLFYRMYNPYDKNHKKIIRMNKGKGYWEFLQQNIIDESGNTISNRIRKISSEINNSEYDQQIKKDVEYILKPIYEKYNTPKKS